MAKDSGYFLSKLSGLQVPFVAVVSKETREIHEYSNTETTELAGGFAVRYSYPYSHFLTGMFVSARWDVDEMLGRKAKIVGTWRELQLYMPGPFGMRQFSSSNVGR